jgi:hypothetical protein
VIRDQRFKFHGDKMVSKFTFFKSFWAFQPELKGLRKKSIYKQGKETCAGRTLIFLISR